MEIWDVVALVLGSNFIMAIVTFFATKIQVKHSDKRLEKELERQREVDARTWRRDVRSKPLLKLRYELARMVSKLKPLVIDTRGQHYRSGITEDEKNKELERAAKDLELYLVNGNLLRTLNIQYDAELLKLVDQIESKYHLLFVYALHYQTLSHDLQKEFNKNSQEIDKMIHEVQELINKKLEEL